MAFFSSLVFMLFLFSLFVVNFIMWWSVFLCMTILFIFFVKSSSMLSTLMNYFIFQEFLGLVFLFYFFSFQFVVLMLKIGVSPLHFWVFSITNSLGAFSLMWFLTMQKIPFLPVLIYFFSYVFFMFLLLGVVFCYMQLFNVKSFKDLFIISSAESFSWLLLVLFFSFLGFFYFCFFYFVNMFFVIFWFNSGDKLEVSWEMVLVFMSFPLTATFFVKVYSLYFVFNFFFVFFLLLLMFLSLLVFSFWLMELSMASLVSQRSSFKIFSFLPLFFIILFY